MDSSPHVIRLLIVKQSRRLVEVDLAPRRCSSSLLRTLTLLIGLEGRWGLCGYVIQDCIESQHDRHDLLFHDFDISR